MTVRVIDFLSQRFDRLEERFDRLDERIDNLHCVGNEARILGLERRIDRNAKVIQWGVSTFIALMLVGLTAWGLLR